MRLTALAWRNLKRHRVRTLLTVLGVAVAAVTLLTILSFNRGYDRALDEEMEASGVHLYISMEGCPMQAASLILHGGEIPTYLDQQLLAYTQELPEVRTAGGMLISTVIIGGPGRPLLRHLRRDQGPQAQLEARGLLVHGARLGHPRVRPGQGQPDEAGRPDIHREPGPGVRGERHPGQELQRGRRLLLPASRHRAGDIPPPRPADGHRHPAQQTSPSCGRPRPSSSARGPTSCRPRT